MRRIGVLLALNALLALALLATRGGGEDGSRPVFRLPALAGLDRIEIRRTGQRDVTLTRAGPTWTVDGAPVDAYALADLEAALAEPVGADQAVPLARADEDAFGVGEHALTVTLGGEAGARTVRIGKSVDDRRTFVRPLDEAVIYRARADLRQAFDRPATHWRERRLFERTIDEVAALTSTVGERVDWSARRAGPEAAWQMTAPEGVEGGQDEIGAVANTLATAQARDFAPAGTVMPVVSTLVAETFGGESFGLALGPVAEDGSMPVQVIGSSAVAIVPRHLALFLAARASDLRERRVFEAEVNAVIGVVIAGTPPIRLVRAEGRWRMTSPSDQAVPAVAVEGWLSGLLGLRVAGFPDVVPADAFASPVHRLGLLLLGDRQVELEVGAEWRGGARFARTSDRPARVVVLAAGTLAGLQPAPELFTSATVDQPLR